jgi:hypothetical protein
VTGIHNAKLTEKAASFAHKDTSHGKDTPRRPVPSNVTPVHSLLQSLVSNASQTRRLVGWPHASLGTAQNTCMSKEHSVCVGYDNDLRDAKRGPRQCRYCWCMTMEDCGQSYSAEQPRQGLLQRQTWRRHPPPVNRIFASVMRISHAIAGGAIASASCPCLLQSVVDNPHLVAVGREGRVVPTILSTCHPARTHSCGTLCDKGSRATSRHTLAVMSTQTVMILPLSHLHCRKGDIDLFARSFAFPTTCIVRPKYQCKLPVCLLLIGRIQIQQYFA